MVQSRAKAEHPVRRGMWGMAEAFADAMAVCMMVSPPTILRGPGIPARKGWSVSASAAASAPGYTMKPPSAVRTCPVRKEARSEAKKATAWATSSGVPRRPRGVSSTSI